MRNTRSKEPVITELTVADFTTGPTPKPHTSFSQIDTYKRCSLQWYYRYILGQKSPPGLALARGKAGHAALEYNARKKISTGADAPLADILDKFSDAYDAETNDADLIVNPDQSIGATKDLTVETIRVYRNTVAPSRFPLKVEHAFELDIPASEAYEHPIKIINGRIDLIEIDPDLALAYLAEPSSKPPTRIVDYKYSKFAKKTADADMSWQLTLYDIVINEATGGRDVASLGFMTLQEPTKTLPARITETLRSPEEMEPGQRQKRRDRLIHVLRTTQKAIDAGIYLPTDNPMICGWCGYRQSCQSSLAKTDWTTIQQKGA